MSFGTLKRPTLCSECPMLLPIPTRSHANFSHPLRPQRYALTKYRRVLVGGSARELVVLVDFMVAVDGAAEGLVVTDVPFGFVDDVVVVGDVVFSEFDVVVTLVFTTTFPSSQ